MSPVETFAVPGTVLVGKYRVERLLGEGGMGFVIEARHLTLQERVAIKFLLPAQAKVASAAQRFLREARAAVRIRSEHVARVWDVGELEDGTPFMVMEYLEGRDLSAVAAGTATPIADAVDYVIQACDALAEAHEYGIVHRDMKPANLFLARRPDGTPLVKVLDFGISKMMNEGNAGLTKTSSSMGSALYMSPEQMHQAKTVDKRTDIYALGVTLYELLAGTQPFHADNFAQLCARVLYGAPTPIASLRPEVPEPLARVMERAYARDRDARYASVSELVFALAPFAPPRSRNLIERIARMGEISTGAGVDAPQPSIAGSVGLAATEPTPPPLAHTNTDLARTDRPGARRAGGGLAASLVFGLVVVACALAAVVFYAVGLPRDVTASPSTSATTTAPPAAAAPPAASPELVAAAAPTAEVTASASPPTMDAGAVPSGPGAAAQKAPLPTRTGSLPARPAKEDRETAR